MSRSRESQAKIQKLPPEPPEGVPTPDKVLMVHPGKGYRWVPRVEREKKERWGYGFVRDYNAADEFTTVRVEDMNPAQLRARAEALDGMAEEKDRAKTDKEKEFEASEARRAAEEAANEERVNKAAERRRSRRSRG